MPKKPSRSRNIDFLEEQKKLEPLLALFLNDCKEKYTDLFFLDILHLIEMLASTAIQAVVIAKDVDFAKATEQVCLQLFDTLPKHQYQPSEDFRKHIEREHQRERDVYYRD